MAAAWSFTKKERTSSMRRVVYGTSLDGFQLRARLCFAFDPPVDRRHAETVIGECARVARQILDEQISQGKLPLTRDELCTRVRTLGGESWGKSVDLAVDAIDVVDELGECVARSQAPAAPAPTRSTVPPPRVSSVPPTLASPSSPGRSGVIPAVSSGATPREPDASTGVRTLWPRALSKCEGELSAVAIGRLMAAAFRDSVAVFIYSAVIGCESTQADRMSFLEGQAPRVVVDGLRLEATACTAVTLYAQLLSVGLPQNIAVEILQAMCDRALPAVGLPVKEVSRYMASGSPEREFVRRAAALLGHLDQSPAIRRQMDPALSTLKNEMQICAREARKLVGLA